MVMCVMIWFWLYYQKEFKLRHRTLESKIDKHRVYLIYASMFISLLIKLNRSHYY